MISTVYCNSTIAKEKRGGGEVLVKDFPLPSPRFVYIEKAFFEDTIGLTSSERTATATTTRKICHVWV